MTERATGADAMMFNFDRPGLPFHTLKVAVLDPSRRGAPLTLADVKAFLEPRLGVTPRLTQRMATTRVSGIGWWVDDDAFDLDAHLAATDVDAPGDAIAFDRLLSRAATERLDLSKPLWHATLVDGLDGGRQALVLKLHHAVADGLRALNLMLALTSQTQGGDVATWPRSPATDVSPTATSLVAGVVAAEPARAVDLAKLVASTATGVKATLAYRREHGLPSGLGVERHFTSNVISGERVAGTLRVPFDRFRAIAKAAGVTVNGVLHAAIAGALRAEYVERGEDVTMPSVATFGIAADATGDRRHGNFITPTFVHLATHVADPGDRLEETAASCAVGVALRRNTGIENAGRWAEYAARLGPWFATWGATRMPKVNSTVVTANVPGPTTTRWIGDVEVVDWISFAVAVCPSSLNLTVYSYAGSMNIGLLTGPEVFADPYPFLRRIEDELRVLEAAVIA